MNNYNTLPTNKGPRPEWQTGAMIGIPAAALLVGAAIIGFQTHEVGPTIIDKAVEGDALDRVIKHDCSNQGLDSDAFDVPASRYASVITRNGRPIEPADLQPGDTLEIHCTSLQFSFLNNNF